MGMLEDDITEGHRRQNQALEVIMDSIEQEVRRAIAKHGPMHSAHEAYGVIAEEWHEFMLALHANNKAELRREAKQIAAMCARFLLDVQ